MKELEKEFESAENEIEKQVRLFQKAEKAYFFKKNIENISKQLKDFPNNFAMGFVGVSYLESTWYVDKKDPENSILKIDFIPNSEADFITFLFALIKERYPDLFDYFIKDKLNI